MTVMSPPRHPLVVAAYRDARALYGEHRIEDRPALAHSAAVAVALVHHVPDVSADLVAAALLHDTPEFAPASVDVPAFLRGRYGAHTAHVVLALANEHQALDQPDPPIETDDYPVLLLSTVDKAVAFGSNLARAAATGDAPAYFAAKTALVNLLDYFRRYHRAGVGLLPATLTEEYGHALDQVDAALTAFHARPQQPGTWSAADSPAPASPAAAAGAGGHREPAASTSRRRMSASAAFITRGGPSADASGNQT